MVLEEKKSKQLKIVDWILFKFVIFIRKFEPNQIDKELVGLVQEVVIFNI